MIADLPCTPSQNFKHLSGKRPDLLLTPQNVYSVSICINRHGMDVGKFGVLWMQRATWYRAFKKRPLVTFIGSIN